MNEGTLKGCMIKKTDYVISQHHVTTQQKCKVSGFSAMPGMFVFHEGD